MGVDAVAVREALATFRGTKRRFETKLRHPGLWVVDDYAHHPTAVRATLAAAREVHRGDIWAVFQPHTTNRVATLIDQFATAFADADHVLVTPIYQPAGRETTDPCITSKQLAARMKHPDARAVTSLDDALQTLAHEVTFGALVITLGAGDVTELAERIAGGPRSAVL
ncbi:MAG: hypothetical protein IT336_09605 [Thermomicrobiales bacterium]|nr:hypothetical protein [Thermomicrobiales bacterium]